ncbi:MAG TPA: lysophospholipid acyltransferase family protein, partial [Candidatus Acidoferrales bacterium]|nr:lysophospholipid acyltransferase family protein [Candidatus Acidoferrales bacterium]
MMPFDRERAQLESLEDALDELANGRSVLMFPEGTRSLDGEIHEFKSGAGYLALRSHRDVVPVLIRGTHEVMGKGSLIPRRRPVEVRIGRAITAAEMRAVADSAEGAGAYRKLSDMMRDAVIALAGSRRGAIPRVPIAPVEPAPAAAQSVEDIEVANVKPDRSHHRPRGHAKA